MPGPLESLRQRMAEARPGDAPFVTLAFAQSLDGSIAAAGGGRLALSGPEALRLTHELRAMHDGILVGAGTVLADDPRLDVRLVDGRSPRPVVLDSRLRTPPTARLFGGGRRPLLVTPRSGAAARGSAAEVLVCPAAAAGGVDLRALLPALLGRGIHSLMVEGGARVITSFLAARLVDHVVLTIAPRFVGGLACIAGRPELHGLRLEDLEVSQLGADLVLSGVPTAEVRAAAAPAPRPPRRERVTEIRWPE